MPKIQRGVRYQKTYSENDLEKAVSAVQNEEMSRRKAASLFNIPRSTLLFRLSDNFRKNSHGPPPILSSSEENLLVNWIIESGRKGFPRRKQDIQLSVKEFLDDNPRENPFRNNLPGTGWYKAFLKRHRNLVLRTSEAITNASACVSENDIKKWFSSIEIYLKEENLFYILEHPDRIFNGDETAFIMCPKNKKVLAARGAKNVYEIDRGSAKANITVMFTFSASGEITPPMIIYPYTRLPTEILISVPKTWGIGLSPNGWMKSEIFYEYIANVFYPSVKNKGITFPIILFLDGHSSHVTYKLSELCSKLEIILICLYPNSTRILQPADVAAFKPLKVGWKEGVLKWRRNFPEGDITKERFAPILEEVVTSTLNKNIIKNGFKACGLYPWDKNILDYSKCLGKIKEETTDIENKEKLLSYENFTEIVGEDTIKLFNEINTVIETNEPSYFSKVYKVWQYFNAQKEEEYDIENMPIIFNDPELAITTSDSEKIEYETSQNEAEEENENSNLNNYLMWPITPQRKGKRNVQKLPYVLTSEEWKKIQTKKIEDKKIKEKDKEARKLKRLENKESKMKKIKKPPIKQY